jgi:hypothetical protein
MVGFQFIGLGCFNQTEKSRTCPGAFLVSGKQPVFATHDKWPNGILSIIVVRLGKSLFRVSNQPVPLIHERKLWPCQANLWSVLQHFGKSQYAARNKYRDFVEKGIGRGRNPEMTGGGLLRSIGGWGVLKSMRRINIHIKGDERILGDSDFVEKVLSQASEQMERRYQLKAEGWTLTKITGRVAEIFGIETEVGKYLGLSKSAVSRAVTRGQKLIVDQYLSLKG